jgi:hypothetical protein
VEVAAVTGVEALVMVVLVHLVRVTLGETADPEADFIPAVVAAVLAVLAAQQEAMLLAALLESEVLERLTVIQALQFITLVVAAVVLVMTVAVDMEVLVVWVVVEKALTTEVMAAEQHHKA